MQHQGLTAASQATVINVCFVVGILGVISGVAGQSDPCQNYETLNEVERSIVYTTDNVEDALCDIDKMEGWYRFSLPAGVKMPESCVDRFRCGTVAPIWLRGAHPTAAGQEVTGTACTNLSPANCCDNPQNIQIRNCGDFYVYYLYPAKSCYAAYCAVSIMPCPPGQWSSSGLGPNCRKEKFPKLKTKPTLEGPLIIGKTFVFNCKVNFPPQDPDQRLEVVWLFDGKEDAQIRPQVLSDPARTATLDGALLKGRMGKGVGCSVRAYYKNGNGLALTTGSFSSNVYWAGIMVSPLRVEVSEDGTESQVTLTSTIPLICDHNMAALCVVTLALDENGPSKGNVQVTKCIYFLKASNWNINTNTVSTTVTVAASKNKILDGNRNTTFSFREISSPVGGAYVEAFTNHRVQSIQVFVKDTKSWKCTATGDPHFTGFKRNYFHHYEAGVFTMYSNTQDDFEFQMQTFPCARSVTCTCGVAFKENNDVIRIDGCRNLKGTPIVTVPTGRLSEGTVIKRSSDGRHITIYFPSQREVKLDAIPWYGGKHYQNVYFTVPGSDIKGTSGGICGTLDKNLPAKQYKFKDGTVHPVCHGCVQTEFAQSWSVSNNKNLFLTVPQSNDQDNNRYCKCDEETRRKLIDCKTPPEIVDPVKPCRPNCKTVIPDKIKPKRRRRDAENDTQPLEDQDEDDPPAVFEPATSQDFNISWPTPSGITEAVARERCMQRMQRSQMWARCGQLQSMVDTSLQSCITDTFFSDSFLFVESALATFTADCEEELALDPINYVNNSDGTRVMAPEISTQLCSICCLQHGNCLNGQCVCDQGFTGDNCQLDITKGPQLQRLRSARYCDVNQRLCRKIFFDATNIQDGENFRCKIQEVGENGHLLDKTHKDQAEFLSSNRLACPLPDARVKTERWTKTFSVSVTNDDRLYGNDLRVIVFDSTCQVCNDSSGCSQKANTCLIDGRCYVDGTVSADSSNQICNSSISIDKWTIVILSRRDQSRPSDGAILGIGTPLWTLLLLVFLHIFFTRLGF